MGALRIGKLAKYLEGRGHDVRVLSCADLPFDRTLSREFPDDRVVLTRYVDVNALPKAVQRLRVGLSRTFLRRPKGSPNAQHSTSGAGDGAKTQSISFAKAGLRVLRTAYQEVLNIPDPQIGWLPYGIASGRKMLSGWRPDVLFASAPPFTTLLIGRSLARRFHLPWVVEYRDRFFEDPYSPPTRLRKCLERWMENRWIRGAAGIVTVSEPWALDYASRFRLPVETVYNGFDPDEYPVDYPRLSTSPKVLRIVYTGILYPERRDPSPLFSAIGLLGRDRGAIRVEFYGSDPATIREMAERANVTDCVEINNRIPYRQSLETQMNADILLLLQWNDPRERGNVPGKLFEYMAARRPVLAIGPEDGVPAKLLKDRGAGVVVNDPAEIKEQLCRWLTQKRESGTIPLTPIAAREGLSRPDQYWKLENFLARAAAKFT